MPYVIKNEAGFYLKEHLDGYYKLYEDRKDATIIQEPLKVFNLVHKAKMLMNREHLSVYFFDDKKEIECLPLYVDDGTNFIYKDKSYGKDLQSLLNDRSKDWENGEMCINNIVLEKNGYIYTLELLVFDLKNVDKALSVMLHSGHIVSFGIMNIGG